MGQQAAGLGEAFRQVDQEEAQALADDLLRTSDTICRKKIAAFQKTILAEYDRLIMDEMKKTPDVAPERAQSEAEWRLREQLRQLRKRLLAFGSMQEDIRRERDRNILEWMRARMR